MTAILIHLAWASGYVALGFSLNYLWRQAKIRLRIGYVAEDPARLEAMNLALRMTNARLNREIADKDKTIVRLHDRLEKK